MKINCGPTRTQARIAKRERLSNWHPFFAIWPRRVWWNDCRWMEAIERRGRWSRTWDEFVWVWEYRAKGSA